MNEYECPLPTRRLQAKLRPTSKDVGAFFNESMGHELSINTAVAHSMVLIQLVVVFKSSCKLRHIRSISYINHPDLNRDEFSTKANHKIQRT